MSTIRPRGLSLLRVALGAVGLAFLVFAARETWQSSRGAPVPPAINILGGLLLLISGLVAAGRGWLALLKGAAPAPAIVSTFYEAQLAKYIPGGIWQAAGHVGLSAHIGVPAVRAMWAFPVYAAVQCAAAGTVGAILLIVGRGLPVGTRLASLGGLALLASLRRVWLLALLRRLFRRRAVGAESVIPSQEALLRAWAWSIGTLIASGAALALLSRPLGAEATFLRIVSAFALAWVCGFLVVIVPAGIGAREAVLVVLVGSSGAILAASLFHRLATIVAELLVFGLTKLWPAALAPTRPSARRE